MNPPTLFSELSKSRMRGAVLDIDQESNARRAPTASVAHNAMANAAGQGVAVLTSFALVPMYFRFLGPEGYGLIGVFGTIQGLSSLLDLGISAAVVREMARYGARPGRVEEQHDFARTIEMVYWALGVVIALAVVGAAPHLAHSWLVTHDLSPDVAQSTVTLMGILLLFQWPQRLYAAGLIGLQRQIPLNLINSSSAVIRGVGAVLILWLISPTVEVYFGWLIFIGTLQTSATAISFWQSLPTASRKARFQPSMLRVIMQLSAGFSALSAVVLVQGQFDKVLLSRLLPLHMFGYYSLASTVAGTLSMMIQPIGDAIFPRMARLAAQHEDLELGAIYHRGCQLIATLIFPIGSVLAFFSTEAIAVWSGDSVVASEAHVLVSLLVVASAMGALMTMLDWIQMVSGWLRPAILVRLTGLTILFPVAAAMAQLAGAEGVAMALLVANAGYVCVTPHFVFRRLLQGEKWRWYSSDIGVPLLTALGVSFLVRVFVPLPTSRLLLLVCLVAVTVATYLVAAVSTEYPRQLIVSNVRRLRGLAAA